VETAITSNNIQFSEAEDRSSLLNFYNKLEELVEAALKINTQPQEAITQSVEID
jgi:hypothetical protein